MHDYLSTKFPLRDDTGRVYAVAGTSTDITAFMAQSRVLAESERRWRAVYEESPVGISLSDEHGHFVAANSALCALLGREEADVVGCSSAEFTHPDDLDSPAARRIADHRRAGRGGAPREAICAPGR